MFSDFGVRLNNRICSTVGLPYPSDLSPWDIANFSCVDDKLYRGSQPSISGSRWIEKRGMYEISLRAEGPLPKRGLCIRVDNFGAPSFQQVSDFISFLGSARFNGSIAFVHCEDGLGRTGTFVACYRVSRYGWNARQAVQEAMRFRFAGLWFKPMTEAQIKFVYEWEAKNKA